MATRVTKPKSSNGGELKLAKVREEDPAKTAKKIRVENVGPNREFEDLLWPGLNFLCGGNGVGKSTFQTFIANANGGGIPVSVTDGEQVAKLIVDDALVYEYKRPKGEQPRITLGSINTAALVVDPGKLDPATAEEWRLKHVMKLVRAETTDEMIEYFLTHPAQSEEDTPRFDAEAYDYVDVNYPGGIDALKQLDPVAAVDVLIKGTGGYLHKLKRDYRDKAANAEARYTVANPQKPVQLSELSLDEAEEEYRNAVGDHRQVQGEASQRAQRERERAEIEQTLGDRPDVFEADALVEVAEEEHGLITAEILELEKKLSAARAKATSTKVVLDQRRKDATEARRAAESWDRRNAILETPIVGATMAEVEKAAGRVTIAKSALELARETAEYRKKLEVAEAAELERKTFAAREADIKKLANDLPARLAEQFNRLGIPGARVNEGVLEVKNEKGKWEPFHRRSVGQQWDWILPIHAAHNAGGTMALPKAVLAELQREWVISNHETFLKHGIRAIVEVTTFEGDPMHMVPFDEFLPRLTA